MRDLIGANGFVENAGGKFVFSYPYPIPWAPFSLVGDGAAARPSS